MLEVVAAFSVVIVGLNKSTSISLILLFFFLSLSILFFFPSLHKICYFSGMPEKIMENGRLEVFDNSLSHEKRTKANLITQVFDKIPKPN